MKSFSRLCMVFLVFYLFPVVTQSQETIPANISIECDGVILKGKFYVAGGEGIFPTIILLQGFPGNEADVLDIGKKLSEAGLNALTFNFSGTYQSQGEYSWQNSQKNIKSAYNFINQSENIRKYKIDTTFIYLGGYSMGGGMALTYAANHPEIKAVFSVAGADPGEFMIEYSRNADTRKLIDEVYARLRAPKGPVRFAKGGTPKEMAELNIIELNPTFHLRKCAHLLAQKDILLIGGWDDYFGSVENAVIDDFILPLYRALQNEKAQNVTIVAFQDNHSFRNSREDIAHVIIEWIKTTPERE
ncbi:MAG: alpha/beta fold hydrolase [Bacteroidales bacterium]|nr:MAG: alpha/beta fold hydrolase [Bacteroidales bacterium]